MTPEEMERAIEFLLEHHAKFAAELQQSQEETRLIRETQLDLHVQMGKLGEAVIALTGMVGRVAEAQIKTDARVAEIAEAQVSLAEAQTRTETELAEVAERLNSFIVVVERYISENRNGRNS